ncbi:MAG: hypothetical protein DYG89_49445 [Caldilinea sp. CFX5]|nr:hypothetical protein [Caldilinea sp. CFX5]
MKPLRLSYQRIETGQTSAGELAYLPITISTTHGSVELTGLLDSGSTVNVLPYTVGLALGFSWEQQTIPIALTGSLAKAPAYGVIVAGKVGAFPAVELAFAWTQAAHVPLILGQVNFFMEFDVCFFRSQAAFEVKPKVGRR